MLVDIDTSADIQISKTYDAGFVALSYLVSAVGCATCLEILHRRTARHGPYNWYLLISSAIAMGGIGMWSMHFIGDRAIHIHVRTHIVPLKYNCGFTALSFFIPIVVLILAFYSLGVSERANTWNILFAGVLAGAAACGMHYVGEQGIENYSSTHAAGNIVGSAIIAVSASIIALGVFFRSRAAWTNTWWKRILSAALLAGAVSAMHWVVEQGTHYRLTSVEVDTGHLLTAKQAVIVCSTLALFASMLLLLLAVITSHQHWRSASKVRQLVLACVYFNPSGGIMVSSVGSIPTQKITDHFVYRSFHEDEFSRSHAAFIWAFRATRNWQTMAKLIPGMKYHLLNTGSIRPYCPGYSGDGPGHGDDPDIDFGLVFKELFCVAAQKLAAQVDQPLLKLGVLHDDVMVTGTRLKRQMFGQVRELVSHNDHDLEQGQFFPTIGKGQLLFVIRRLDQEDTKKFIARGYRFARTRRIAHTLASQMQVPRTHILRTLGAMKCHSRSKPMKPGVYFVLFSIYPRLRGGFDVLVLKASPNLLPHRSLRIKQVTQWQADILGCMDGWSLMTCLTWLKGNGEYADPEKIVFCQKMRNAISKFANYLVDPEFGEAKFSAHPICLPCQSSAKEDTPTTCVAFPFLVINGLQSRKLPRNLCLSPLRLFNAQQQVYPGAPDQEQFRRAALEEFAHCFNKRSSGKLLSVSSPPPETPEPGPSSDTAVSCTTGETPQSSSEVERPSVDRMSPKYGGIVVKSQVDVDVIEYAERPTSSDALGTGEVNTTTVEGGYTHMDRDTFVDELIVLCREMMARRVAGGN